MLLPQQVIWWQILLPISIEISHCRSDSKARKGGMESKRRKATWTLKHASVRASHKCPSSSDAPDWPEPGSGETTRCSPSCCSSLMLPVLTRCLLLEVRFCARKHIHLHTHEYRPMRRLHYCSDVGVEG